MKNSIKKRRWAAKMLKILIYIDWLCYQNDIMLIPLYIVAYQIRY